MDYNGESMKTLLLITLLINHNSFANEKIKDIRELENKLKLPVRSLETIIKMESRFNENAINKNAPIHSYGIGQLTLATAKICGLTIETILDYKKNLECSASVFKSKLDRYKQDLYKAVVAYNEGTPCICNGEEYVRDLGVTKRVCSTKSNDVDGKVILKPMKCDVKGKLLETKYLLTFKKAYISL